MFLEVTCGIDVTRTSDLSSSLFKLSREDKYEYCNCSRSNDQKKTCLEKFCGKIVYLD